MSPKKPSRAERLDAIETRTKLVGRVLGYDEARLWLCQEVRRGDRLAEAIRAALEAGSGPTAVGDYIRSREALVEAVRAALAEWEAGR